MHVNCNQTKIVRVAVTRLGRGTHPHRVAVFLRHAHAATQNPKSNQRKMRPQAVGVCPISSFPFANYPDRATFPFQSSDHHLSIIAPELEETTTGKREYTFHPRGKHTFALPREQALAHLHTCLQKIANTREHGEKVIRINPAAPCGCVSELGEMLQFCSAERRSCVAD